MKNSINLYQKQKGFALLESLIAILVMALGILGILGMQIQTLTSTQNSLYRGQAIRFIEDFSERLISNPNSLAHTSKYLSGWKTNVAKDIDCSTTECNPQELAKFDLWNWKNSVANILPEGDANIFLAPDDSDTNNIRQLGVMIAWRENESSPSTLLNNYSGSGTTSCPPGKTCHFQYVPLYARCLPYNTGGTTSEIYCRTKS